MAVYGYLMEALDNIYGSDVMYKFYQTGKSLGFNNKDWFNAYTELAERTPELGVWKTANGEWSPFVTTQTTTSVSTDVLSSTSTELVTMDSAFTTEVGTFDGEEILQLSQVGNTASTATSKIGDFVLGKAVPAVAAVATGALVGVGVDTLLYDSNPNYWNENLPTLSPETWDDIVLGHDTKIPFLHNIRTKKSYVSDDFLAYTTLLANKNGWLTTEGEYEEKTDDNYNAKAYKYTITSLPNGGYFGNATIGWKYYKFNYTIKRPMLFMKTQESSYNPNTETFFISGVIASSNRQDIEEAISINNNYYDTVHDNVIDSTNAISSDSVHSYTLDNKTVYWSLVHFRLTSDPYTLSTSDEFNYIPWVAIYGNHTTKHGSDLPTGVSHIGVVPDFTGINTMAGAKTKLRQTYPNLYNNALEVPYYDPNDDTFKTSTWLPTSLPNKFNNNNENQPTSDNMIQSDDSTYPDDETETETLNKTVTPSVTVTPPENINPTNPIIDPTPTPTPSTPVTPTDTGLGAVYIPTVAQLKQFSAWLWSDSFIEQIKKLFSDPMQAIIGLHQVYFTPTNSGATTIHTGYLDSGVNSNYTEIRYYNIDCGVVNIRETFGNVFDYDPYTTIEIYLPFIGIVPLKVGDVMRSSVNVVYTCDILTGACLCNIYVLRDGAKCLLYTYGGNCAVNYPLSSGSYMGIVSALAGVGLSIGTAIATGGASIPLSIGGGAVSMLNAHTNVKTSGGYGGNTGAMGIKTPYIIIKNTLSAMPNNYNKYIGNPYNNTIKLSTCKGYTQVTSVHLVGDMTDEEKTEINNLLVTGVIL